MNIKNNDLLSITVANSGDQKEYFPVNEFKEDIITDILVNIAAPVLATDSVITEDDNSPTISITVTKNTFKDELSEEINNWVIDLGTTGLAVDIITKKSATEIGISLSGTAALGTIRILALKDCFEAPIVDSTVLEIEVQKPKI